MFNQSCPVIQLWSYFWLITLKNLAMLKVLESVDFCIFIRHSLALFSPNNSFILFRTLSEYPPNTSTMMLICLTTYPGYLSFISHLSGTYFVVFSVSSIPLFPIGLARLDRTCRIWADNNQLGLRPRWLYISAHIRRVLEE